MIDATRAAEALKSLGPIADGAVEKTIAPSGKALRRARRAAERSAKPKPGYRPNYAQVSFLALQEMRQRHPGFRNIIDENGEHV